MIDSCNQDRTDDHIWLLNTLVVGFHIDLTIWDLVSPGFLQTAIGIPYWPYHMVTSPKTDYGISGR